MRVTGVLFGVPWRGVKWCFATKTRALVSTLVLFGGFTGGTYEAYHYSMSSGFCHSCHLMLPYCESWKKSTHHGVDCVQCHFEPGLGNELHGKWVALKQLASAVTGAYSPMPYAEVSDASCMRSGCHSSAELAKPVTFSDRSIGFKHETHAKETRRGIKLACTSCHFQKTIDTHIAVDKATCFLCHFKAGHEDETTPGACDTCHGPPSKVLEVAGFEVDHAKFKERGMACIQCHAELRPSTTPVGEERCLACHNRRDYLEKISDFGLMHVEHVTKHKLHCYQCHTLIEHKFDRKEQPAPGAPGGDCAACHVGAHGPQGRLYAGLGAIGVASMPDKMHALGLDCVGCHRDPSVAKNGDNHERTVPARSCATCHEKTYDSFVPGFNAASGKMLEHAGARLAAVQRKLEARRKAGHLLDRAVYRKRETAVHNLRFLREAVAVHNPVYAVAVLRATRDLLLDLEEAVGIEFDGDLPVGFEPEDCAVCHDHLPKPVEVRLATGRVYPHNVHVEETGLDCTDCHQGATHPPLAPTNETSCASCHKGDKKLPPLPTRKKKQN